MKYNKFGFQGIECNRTVFPAGMLEIVRMSDRLRIFSPIYYRIFGLDNS